jgi:hypothetical protein
MRFSKIVLFYGALFVVVFAGCGDGKISRYPVTGSVTVDGKPAEGAMVIFCPTEGSEELQKTRPFALTDASGKFQLTTFGETDGAPAGNYKILIQWPVKLQPDARNPQGGFGEDRLKGRYMNLEKSQLTATIEEGPTDLPPFALTSS